MSFWSLLNPRVAMAKATDRGGGVFHVGTPKPVEGSPLPSEPRYSDGHNEQPPVVAPNAFITPQSLTSFPIATFVVSMIWKAAGILRPGFDTNPWVGAGIALVIGLAVAILSINDPDLRLTRRQQIVGLLVALINCVYLFVAATGATKVSQ